MNRFIMFVAVLLVGCMVCSLDAETQKKKPQPKPPVKQPVKQTPKPQPKPVTKPVPKPVPQDYDYYTEPDPRNAIGWALYNLPQGNGFSLTQYQYGTIGGNPLHYHQYGDALVYKRGNNLIFWGVERYENNATIPPEEAKTWVGIASFELAPNGLYYIIRWLHLEETGGLQGKTEDDYYWDIIRDYYVSEGFDLP